MTEVGFYFEPNGACLACGTPVFSFCEPGRDVPTTIDCRPVKDGPDRELAEFEQLAGRLRRTPAGWIAAHGVMRFAEHKRTCKSSLRPDPSDVPTRPVGPRQRRPLP